MIIVRNGILPFRGYKAMALWPFVFVRREVRFSEVDMNHEEIHGRQQWQLLLVGFLLLYALFYLCGLCAYGSTRKAYRENPFEREAFRNQDNPDYLSRMRWWSWMRYIIK